jgi:hypothetical protein
MDVSPISTSTVSSAMGAGDDVKSQLAIVAMKAAQQSQAALLQLFQNATPSADTGRGQNVNISA